VTNQPTLKLLVLLLVGFLRAGAQTPPANIEVTQLIHAAQVNGEKMSRRVFEYSWQSKTTVRQFNKRGRLLKEVEQDHEAYPSPALTFVVQKLVRENGLPLSAGRAKKEQKRVASQLMVAEIEEATFQTNVTQIDKNTGCPVFGIWTTLNDRDGKETSLGISDFLCFAEFSAPRLESREGRDTVVLRFRPRDRLPPLPGEKSPFAKLTGIIWIDLKDKLVTHVEAWPSDNFSSGNSATGGQAVAPIIFDDMRLPDGVWVRRARYVDTRKDPAAFNGLRVEWKQEFSGYVRYFTETKGFKEERPGPPAAKPPR
jgi:hypothetical protein